MSKKKALVTGASGQDASWLMEILLEKGYEVYGIVRQSSTKNLWRIQHILDKVTLVEGDLTDYTSLYRIIKNIMPNEVYNLGAMSFVGASWDNPLLSMDVTGTGCLRLLECIRDIDPKGISIYQASTSELFGGVMNARPDGMLDENCPFYPKSPYGIAKAAAHYSIINYRESYGIFAVGGILFNHSGERRGEEFILRKISTNVAKIKLGLSKEIRVGNVKSKRDFGHARDYMEAAYLMLQQKEPKDYVIASGVTHSIEDALQFAFSSVGLNYQDYMVVDPKFFRPAEVHVLLGDSSRARKELGWKPKVSFEEMLDRMVQSDLKKIKDSK